MKFKTILASFFAVTFCLSAVGCNSVQNVGSDYSDTSSVAAIVKEHSSTKQDSTELPEQILGDDEVLTSSGADDTSYIDSSDTTTTVESTDNTKNSQSTVTESCSDIVVSATESEKENTVSKEENQEVSEDSTSSEIESPVNKDGEIELPTDIW